MKRNAFGAIDLLICLFLTAVVFLIGMNALKGTTSLKINNSATDTKSVQEQVDEQVNEIQNMRQQTINYQQNSQSEDY